MSERPFGDPHLNGAGDDGAATPEPRRTAPASADAVAGLGLHVLGVSEVTRVVRDAVRGDPRLREVWVEGEVGRVTISAAGHAYFTLKDERSQLPCVIFARELRASPFEPRTGLHVVARGRVDVYEAQGTYQLYVDALQPSGFGDLALRFEALKARLAADGLFDASRKRRLPVRPARIAVVTSPSGAVWHDVRTVVARRWPLVELVLVPCQVQGDAAPPTIVAAFRRLAELPAAMRPDVVILARGGGSLEDLWAFNDEAVVRAVAASPIPVAVGVGHEIDVTLADFAADVRAPTPSAAAELVVPDRAEVLAGARALRARLDRMAVGSVAAAAAGVAAERRALDRLGPIAQLDFARQRAAALLDRATASVRAVLGDRATAAERAVVPLRVAAATRIATARAAVDATAAALVTLGPDATLGRGYAIVRRVADARVVRDQADVTAGDRLAVRVARGEFAVIVAPPADDRRVENES